MSGVDNNGVDLLALEPLNGGRVDIQQTVDRLQRNGHKFHRGEYNQHGNKHILMTFLFTGLLENNENYRFQSDFFFRKKCFVCIRLNIYMYFQKIISTDR